MQRLLLDTFDVNCNFSVLGNAYYNLLCFTHDISVDKGTRE